MRPCAPTHGEGTLTESPRSLDVASRAPRARPPRLKIWASATLVACAGLVVGAVVALNVLSSPMAPASVAQGLAAPPMVDAAPATHGSSTAIVEAPAAALEASASASASARVDAGWSTPPAHPPAAPTSSAAPGPPALPRPPGKRSPTLGI